ncbi:hypothetical protein Gorai_013458, partial [Gossypium raimondii]|nr:hypothetical protein [Gossypium raimondii]
MGKLPLIVLNISRNEFSGQILTEIGNIRCLKNLDLSVNNFSGIFLVELGEPHWFATVVDGIHEWRAKRLLKESWVEKVSYSGVPR